MTGEPIVPAELASRLAQIKLLVLDVDGVLTDGRVYYDDAGGESRVELQMLALRPATSERRSVNQAG